MRKRLTISLILLIGLFVFGYFMSQGAFGGAFINLTLTTNPDLENGLIAHLSFDGEFEQGTFEFGTGGVTTTDPTSSDDQGLAIAADPQGYIYVTGECNGCGSSGSYAHYTYKINPSDGAVLWSTTTDPTSSGDTAYAITSDPSGNIYVAGQCNGCGTNGGTAGYIYKIDPSDGSMLWSTAIDKTSSSENILAITTDPTGYVYATGWCNGCGTNGGVTHYTHKIDPSDGTVLWSTTTDPTSANEGPWGITTDPSGYIYVTGECNGCGSQGSNADYTYKIDPSDGSMLWATTTDPTSADDFGNAIISDSQGYLYVTGYCNGCGSKGSYAHYTYKIDPSDGSMLWATTTDPTSLSDSAYSIAADDNGNLYIAGDCNGCGSSGGFANYVYKVDSSDGSMIWATTTDPSSSTDAAYAVTIDDNGYPYVTGWCFGCGANGDYAHYTYKIDPSDGSMVDTSTSGAVDHVGGPGTAGKIGQALDFDGTDDHVDVAYDGTSLAGSDITVAAWIYPRDLGTSKVFHRIFDDEQAGSPFRGFSFSIAGSANFGTCQNGDICVYTNDTTGDGTDSNGVPHGMTANHWYHVVVTFRNSTKEAVWYRDGESIGSATQNKSIGDNTTDNLRIGNNNLDFSNTFDGLIDDVRVYNKVLSPAEVKRLYELGATTKVNKTITTNPDLENGLVGHWTFDGDLTQQITDRSGQGNNGYFSTTSQATSSMVTSGKIGQGVVFDGVDDYIEVYDGQINTDTQGTLTAWVKLNGGPDSTTIFGYGGADVASTGYFTFEFGPTHVLLSKKDENNQNQQFLEGSTLIVPGPWYHLAAVSDGSQISLYVNGEPEQITVNNGSNMGDWIGDTVVTSPDKTYIGSARYDGWIVNTMDGVIDDVRLYNRPLSAEEVKRLYGLGATTKVNKTITTNPDLESGLVDHWTFDGDLTPQITDRGSQGNDGYFSTTSQATSSMVTVGKIGQGVQFDGVDDYVSINSGIIGNNNAFTIAHWFRTSDSSRIRTYDERNSGDTNPLITISVNEDVAGDAAFCIQDDAATLDCDGEGIAMGLNDGNWHHLTEVQYSKSSRALYIDGTYRDGNTTAMGTLTLDLNGIGRNVSNGNNSFNGDLDDVRIYNRALSDEEIKRLYELGQ